MPSSLDAFAPITGQNFTPTLHSTVPERLLPSSNPLPTPFVVCVTGASRGIGRATALLFAQAGATGLIVTARKLESLKDTIEECKAAARSSELKISPVALDSGNEKDTIALAETIKTEHSGRLDLLINNAGLVSSHESAFSRSFDKIQYDQMRITMECNYFGRFLTMKALLPFLLGTEGGAKMIINVTSICSHFVGFGPTGFNISELASNRLTEIVAHQYRGEGLLAFSVHPGTVHTTLPVGFPGNHGMDMSDEPALCGSFCAWLVRERPEWLTGRYLCATWDTKELVDLRDDIVQGDKLKARMAI